MPSSARRSIRPADVLVPPDDSPRRKSPLVVGMFNLLATIIGGGVLSLPYAFSKTGILLGCVLMVVAAIMTERSLYLLCLCSRLTGATSYGEVGEAAYGKSMEYFISLLLGIFLAFVIVGYMVLVRDIWTSLVNIVLGAIWGTQEPPDTSSELVLLVIVLLMLPFLVQRSLHALRFNCYVGFSSVTILCLALVHHAWETIFSPMTYVLPPLPSPTNGIMWWSTNFEDVLVAFPIFTLSFLSIFNVLPIQNALLQPTRLRMLLVIDGAMLSCFVLTLVFGLAGYIYAGDTTDGNILNNTDSTKDMFMFLGQLGCGITIMLAMPMMLLPCRASLLEVLDVLVNGPHRAPVEDEEEEEDGKAKDDDDTGIKGSGVDTTNGSIIQPPNQVDPEKLPLLSSSNGPPPRSFDCETVTHLADNQFVHYTTTLLLVSICYVASVAIEGVATVWAIIGCFMGYLVSESC